VSGTIFSTARNDLFTQLTQVWLLTDPKKGASRAFNSHATAHLRVVLGEFKVDAFEKCELRISISHFGYNEADFK